MKKISLLLIAFFVLVSCQVQEAQEKLSAAEASSVGFKADFESQIDYYLNYALQNDIIPNGTFLVAKDGKFVYHKSFGDQRPNDPLQNSDIYRLASMTKAVTSVAIMQLV